VIHVALLQLFTPLLYGQDFNPTDTSLDYRRLIGVNEKKGEEEKFIIQAYPKKRRTEGHKYITSLGNYRNRFTPGLLSWPV